MTTKEWLMRAWRIDREIDLLMDARRRALERATSTTAAPRDVRVSGNSPSRGSRPMDAYAALSEQIDRRVDELARVKAEILEAIEQVQDGTLRRLLMERYIHCRTWEQVAVDMHYSYIHVVQNLHPAALRAVKEYIEVYTPPVV